MSDISKNIKKLRKKNGLTQEQLAQKLHMTRQTISGWENDKFYPDLDTVIKLSEILNTDPNNLLYPSGKGRMDQEVKTVSPKWVLLTFAIFFAGMTWGGEISAFVFQKLVGGSVEQTYLYPIYGGIIMLAVLMVICTGIVVETIREREVF